MARTVAVGEAAPTFELAATDGKNYSLREALARGPLLAAFFKVACPTCQYTFPFIERLYQRLRAAGASGVQVWGISQDGADHTRSFAKEYGVTFPILVDADNYDVSREYGLIHVPTLFLISPNGRVEISGDGFCKADLMKIQKQLAKHLAVTPAELFDRGEQIPEFKPG